jgi:hypothetical protein
LNAILAALLDVRGSIQADLRRRLPRFAPAHLAENAAMLAQIGCAPLRG